MHMNKVNESWWMLSLISIKIRLSLEPLSRTHTIKNKFEELACLAIWWTSIRLHHSYRYNVWTGTPGMIWTKAPRRLLFIFLTVCPPHGHCWKKSMWISKDLITISWSYLNIRVIKMNMSIRIFSFLESTAIWRVYILSFSSLFSWCQINHAPSQLKVKPIKVSSPHCQWFTRNSDTQTGRQTNRKTTSTSELGGKQTAARPGEINLLYCSSSRGKRGNFSENTTRCHKASP